MRIGILTQPLHTNYGGLLQNYALQTVLKRMGHEPVTINKQFKRGFRYKLVVILKRLILHYFFNKEVIPLIPYWENSEEKAIIGKYTNDFINKQIVLTNKVHSSLSLKEIEKFSFDAYIVGSDQVWRPRYSPNLPLYFLNFLQKDNIIKKIAFAASFGVDKWELSSKETKMAEKMIKQFNAVSVREDSAVKLCKDNLNVDVEHVLDPTLLLEKDDYVDLVRSNHTNESPGNLFVYILDRHKEKDEMVRKVSTVKNLQPFEIMPKGKMGRGVNIEDCIYPSVYQWLRSFMDAEFVITDSFHGTVFSIIFNKPFLAIGNYGRGLTRFTSLLKLFNIESRLVLSTDELKEDEINANINFNKVNLKCKELKQHSLSFLEKSLMN